jgi:hypothetical protein
MRIGLLIFGLASIVACCSCGQLNAGIRTAAPKSSVVLPADSGKESATEESVPTKVDFASQIQPILEARCQPCHFNGGKVYAKMPFDRQETIKTMGTILFTRIKDENERRLIRDFLAQE